MVDVAWVVAMPVVLAQAESPAMPVDAGSRWQHPHARFIGTDGCWPRSTKAISKRRQASGPRPSLRPVRNKGMRKRRRRVQLNSCSCVGRDCGWTRPGTEHGGLLAAERKTARRVVPAGKPR